MTLDVAKLCRQLSQDQTERTAGGRWQHERRTLEGRLMIRWQVIERQKADGGIEEEDRGKLGGKRERMGRKNGAGGRCEIYVYGLARDVLLMVA